MKAWLQKLQRKYLWRMDIHPTARIASTASIDRTWPKGVHIGPDCVIGEEAVVLTHDMARGIYLDTRIGAGTIVGPRAIILPGVTVGENCRILPGSVVIGDVADGETIGGNPGKPLDRDQPSK